MALNLDNRKAHEIQRLREQIEQSAGERIRKSADAGSPELIESLAWAVHRWRATERNSGIHRPPADAFVDGYSRSLIERTTKAGAALEDLRSALDSDPSYPKLNPQGEGTPLDEFIIGAGKARGLSAEQLSAALAAIDQGIEAAQHRATTLRAEWNDQYGGNRPKAKHYLRLALNDCLSAIQPRKTRARIIATVMVATEIIHPDEEVHEVNRTNQSLRNNQT